MRCRPPLLLLLIQSFELGDEALAQAISAAALVLLLRYARFQHFLVHRREVLLAEVRLASRGLLQLFPAFQDGVDRLLDLRAAQRTEGDGRLRRRLNYLRHAQRDLNKRVV